MPSAPYPFIASASLYPAAVGDDGERVVTGGAAGSGGCGGCGSCGGGGGGGGGVVV